MEFSTEDLLTLSLLDRSATPVCSMQGCVLPATIALRCGSCRAVSLWCQGHGVDAASGLSRDVFVIRYVDGEFRIACDWCEFSAVDPADLVEVVRL